MKLDSVFFEDDTIFHYTKIDTAVNFILPKEELLIRRRYLQRDPVEKHFSNPPYIGRELDFNILMSIDKIPNEITKKIMSKINQISFCQNGFYEKNKYIDEDSLDGAGFAKQRMWATYGAEYSGICFALSKEKLLKELESKIPQNSIHCDNVNYQLNKDLSKHIPNIANYQPIEKIRKNFLQLPGRDYLLKVLIIVMKMNTEYVFQLKRRNSIFL
ncbi:MAG: DUF2971 domain-containing protein [Flavobacteriales bacterium]|nr:DUF2971 domain-containing protein [Flavobacteriales bacterium]